MWNSLYFHFDFLHFDVFFLTAPPQTTPAQMEGSCPENTTNFKWTPYGEYCYGFTTTSSSWPTAQTGCVNAVPSRSCNLVSIHDPIESKFVGDLFVQMVPYADAFWIGLSKTSFGWLCICCLVLWSCRCFVCVAVTGILQLVPLSYMKIFRKKFFSSLNVSIGNDHEGGLLKYL